VITYEYINVAIPPSLEETMSTLKSYGDTGWRVAAMHSGYIFFERRVKTKMR
jgi:hypothetical protein